MQWLAGALILVSANLVAGQDSNATAPVRLPVMGNRGHSTLTLSHSSPMLLTRMRLHLTHQRDSRLVQLPHRPTIHHHGALVREIGQAPTRRHEPL